MALDYDMRDRRLVWREPPWWRRWLNRLEGWLYDLR
jgi:hypothetical protein